MTSAGKGLGTGNYVFYAHQYQLCDIDFPLISTQNRGGKRIVIPGRECIRAKIQTNGQGVKNYLPSVPCQRQHFNERVNGYTCCKHLP